MEITHMQRGDVMTVFLCGELDHHSAQGARLAMDELFSRPGVHHAVVDLKKLSFMDSSGIGVLLGRYKAVAGRGDTMTLLNASAQVDRVLKVAGVYQLIGKERAAWKTETRLL